MGFGFQFGHSVSRRFASSDLGTLTCQFFVNEMFQGPLLKLTLKEHLF